MRSTLTTLVFLLPPGNLKNRLLNRLGHEIHPAARIGICLVQRVARFELAEGVLIGHFNFFRDMTLVKLGRGSRIMMFNQILGDSGFESVPGGDEGDRQTLRMGDYSHIISHHYMDCGGGLRMGDNCWITGIRTTVLTHAFDPHEGVMLIQPVTLGNGAVVATSCTLLPGTVLEDGMLLGAGSTTWTGQTANAHHLYGGVPARRLSKIEIAPHAYDRARFDA